MMKVKFFLILFCSLVLILLFELSLHLVGNIYYGHRIKSGKIDFIDTNITRILCLGDSYTFGLGSPKGYSYPEQLQRMLDNSLDRKVIVFNRSRPGQNSSELLKNLADNIKRYHPNIIIIMVGCNNNSNFDNSNYFLFMRKSPKFYLYYIDSFFSNSLSYKLFKTILLNVKNKIKQNLKLTKLKKDSKKFEKKSDISVELKNKVKEQLELAETYRIQNKINLAITECRKAIELNPLNSSAYLFLGDTYLYHGEELYGEKAALLSIVSFQKAVELEPFDLAVHEKLFNAYYKAGNNPMALNELKIINNLNPANERINRFLAFGLPENQDKSMEVFLKMLKYDLQKVIRMTVPKGIKVILMNYPINWTNGTLKQIAEVNKLFFVDNEAVFEKLASSDGYKRKDYFAEDGHCNAAGYNLIAKNVSNILWTLFSVTN